MDTENPTFDTDLAEQPTAAPDAAAADAPDAEVPDAEVPTEGTEADAASVGDAAGEEAQPQRREVARGIHPELLCNCEECDPDFTELQWFSPEEKKKTRGDLMLYCQRSGRKYFTPAAELHSWLAANPTKSGRGKE